MLAYFLKKTLKKHDLNNNLKLNSLIVASQLRAQSLSSHESGVGNNKEHSIVVSLTSFDKRIHDLYLCIESLFQQFLKADRVILWLSRRNFPGEQLPESLLRQKERGLEIIFYDEDLGPFKKIYYALRECRDSLIITVDDDVLYPPDLIDQLYQAYLEEPDVIHCNRGYRIPKQSESALQPYEKWQLVNSGTAASLNLMPTGVAGVIYFPGCFDEEIFNVGSYQELCPSADDIWLKAMSLKKGVACKKIDDERNWKTRFLTIDGSQSYSLKKKNWKPKTGNDAKLKAVFDQYSLYSKLD